MEHDEGNILKSQGHRERLRALPLKAMDVNIFMAFEPLAGQRYAKVTAQRTQVDWAHFIQELIDQHYPVVYL
jgi:hypothetical protein